jgi:hypothetical protein
VKRIEVFADSVKLGNLELLENMNNVALKTFQANKTITFFKTITRAILKGIGSAELGKSIKGETKDELLGDILAGIANLAVDATENADLRTWRTMPGYCHVGEFNLKEGVYDIEIKFFDELNNLIYSTLYNEYRITRGLNLVEAFYLN